MRIFFSRRTYESTVQTFPTESRQVFGEILSGFKGGKREKQNIEELNLFLDSPRVHLIQIDEETAEFYAEIYWDLRRKGKPVPSNDMWVAASAMKHGLALFTFDEHFNNINVLLLKI